MTSGSTATRRTRTRSAAALTRDAAILDAAVEACTESGLDSLSLTDVARRARLTSGATYARFENPRELLVMLWEQRLQAEFRALVAAAAALIETPAEGSHMRAAFGAPPAVRRTMLATMLAASRVDELSEVVPPAVQDALRDLPATRRAPVTALVSLALGGAIYAPVEGPIRAKHRPTVLALASATSRSERQPRPVVNVAVPFDTGDALRDSLMTATLAVVARSGIHGVSLRRISRVSGYDPTAVYTRYASLAALLDDVVDSATAAGMTPERLAASHGSPQRVLARLRGWELPDAATRRRLNLEFHLALLHDHHLLQRFSQTDLVAFRQAAAHCAPGVPAAAFVKRMQVLRDLQTGAMLLFDLGAAGSIDWRPSVHAIFDGPRG